MLGILLGLIPFPTSNDLYTFPFSFPACWDRQKNASVACGLDLFYSLRPLAFLLRVQAKSLRPLAFITCGLWLIIFWEKILGKKKGSECSPAVGAAGQLCAYPSSSMPSHTPDHRTMAQSKPMAGDTVRRNCK